MFNVTDSGQDFQFFSPSSSRMAKVRKLPQDRNSRHLPAPPFVGLIPETNLQKPEIIPAAYSCT
jgi:hypothetical protein